MSHDLKTLWGRWITANALAEFFGLGATFALIGFFSSRIDASRVSGILLSFGIAVLSGALEATVVGLAQWQAMHPWFPSISRFAWWRATLIGAFCGYVLGYLPSTIMSLGENASQATPVEPARWIVLLMAAGLGIAAGAVLSFAQWLTLRKNAGRSGLWIPANMLAWAFGMPMIFWGMDLAFKMAEFWQSILVIGGTLLVAGIVVGAIHGRFLVLLAKAEKESQPS